MIRCFVTGDSRGLGLALASTLQSQGVEVIGVSSANTSSLPWVHWAVDLSDSAGASHQFQTLCSQLDWSGVTKVWLIHNAGTVQPMVSVAQLPVEDTIRAYALNLVTPSVLTTALLQLAPSGMPVRVLNITSGAASKAYPGWSVYGASKAGLDHFVRVAGEEALGDVRIAAVAPGVVDTQMQAEIRQTSPADFPLHARFVELHESGSLTPPSVVAEQLVEYLISDRICHGEVTDVRQWSSG